jgi:hypothetical protein
MTSVRGGGTWAGTGPSGVCSGVWNAMRVGLTRAVESLQTIDAPLVEIDHWVEGICANCKVWQASTGEGWRPRA